MRTIVLNADGSRIPIDNADGFLITLARVAEKLTGFHGDQPFLPDDELMQFIIRNIDYELTETLCQKLPQYIMHRYEQHPTSRRHLDLMLYVALYVARTRRHHELEITCRTLLVVYGLAPIKDIVPILHDPRPHGFDAKAQVYPHRLRR